MSLGENLKKIRNERNLKQDEVAAKMHISRQAISRWENDKSLPDISTLHAMAEIYEVTLDELVGNKNDGVDFKETQSGKKELEKPVEEMGKNTELEKAVFYIIAVVILSTLSAKGILVGIPGVIFNTWVLSTYKRSNIDQWLYWLVKSIALMGLMLGVYNIYFRLFV